MKKCSLIILLCFVNNKALSLEKVNIIGKNSLYINDENKYMSPFPYDVEIQCNNIKYNWKKSSIIVHSNNINMKLIEAIPNIVYDFKKNFHKNSEDYFKYLINNNIHNNIYNDDNTDDLILDHTKYILAKYNNPFEKNPFIFKINDEIFQWKDSKIFTNGCSRKYKNRLNNIMINFNDSFKYFNYLLQKVVNVQSSKVNIKYDQNITDNYKSLTFDTSIDNPFDNVVVIKDCVRTYRWYEDTIDILFPDWLNDNLSKNNYSIFLQLLENATNNFYKYPSKTNELDDFVYFIQQELGYNILVYALNMENLGWENIDNINSNYTSSVINNNTGFVEVEHNIINKTDNYDWQNDKDDF